jgi:hypothetical protein
MEVLMGSVSDDVRSIWRSLQSHEPGQPLDIQRIIRKLKSVEDDVERVENELRRTEDECRRLQNERHR